ncbi:MAG: DCC1-like thiol-disulfide oxidoreductase family protein [Proteobacteria bacterium]|nr:DCC1-like thiol-disulfide oxidoreductase family protein [Pseudomonadota bacterium]
MSKTELRGPIVFFDGECNLCNDSVKFIIKRDPEKVFKFAPLQSDFSRKFLREHTLYYNIPDSLVLIDKEGLYFRSDAALRVARRLGGLWPLLYTFMVVPWRVRDKVYDIIAHNRYKWFGRRDDCMVPGPEDKERFLE